ncbi:hypothetical protein D9M69_728850 [compost metagenome]
MCAAIRASRVVRHEALRCCSAGDGAITENARTSGLVMLLIDAELPLANLESAARPLSEPRINAKNCIDTPSLGLAAQSRSGRKRFS